MVHASAMGMSKRSRDLLKNSQQAVKLEEMKVLDIEKERMIDIRQKELQASIQRPAEAERFRVTRLPGSHADAFASSKWRYLLR